MTTIAEVAPGSGFALLANGNASMNDSGQVSFGASPSPAGGQAIMRGDGTTLTTIARTSTQRQRFASFGNNTSINDTGEVAFDGQLGSGARGLFSGTDGATTSTHYLNTQVVSVDGSPARFNATSDRPSINNLGDIAFLDEIQGTFRQDIFKGQRASLRRFRRPTHRRLLRPRSSTTAEPWPGRRLSSKGPDSPAGDREGRRRRPGHERCRLVG